MKKHQMILSLAVLAGASASAGTVRVGWDADEKPAALGETVSLTYDDEGAILRLTASPEDDGTVVVDGDQMAFAADAVVALSAPGTLVFSNDVSAAGILHVGEEDDAAEISYSGDVVSGKEYQKLFYGRKLADYDVKSTYFRYPNESAGLSYLLGPIGYGTPEFAVRGKTADGADKLRVLLQQFNDDFLCSVELMLVQDGDDIAGKIISCRYSRGHLNVLGVDLQRYFDEGVKYQNGEYLAIWRSIADASDGTKGFGINQLTMTRRTGARTVRFAGAVPASGLRPAAGTDAVISSSAKTVLSDVSGSGRLSFVSAGTEASFSNAYDGVVKASSKTVVSEGRELADLVKVDGWFRNVNTAHQPIFTTACHLKKSANGKSATCQFQRLVGDVVFCMVVSLDQEGDDIVCQATAGYNHSVNVDGAEFAPGIDFYDPSLPKRGYSAYVEDEKDWGLFLRDLTLTFSTPRPATAVIAGANAMTGGSSMTVAGTAQVPQTVKVKDLGGLPTNGVVTVGAYGILDIVPTELPPIHGSGVSGGKAEIVVQTNGLLRLSQERAFSSYRQIIRLQGGDWETGHGFEYDERADKHFYANDLTLADGACVSGLPVRVGFRAYYPAWRVLGAAPSVCHAPVIAFKTPLDSGKETFFQLYVEDVTGDAAADFIMNGRINLYSGSDDFDEITLVKAGDGCVLQNGASELVMPTEIKRGAWIFGRSGVSEGAQEFRLEGETTLGLAAAVSNGLAKVVVNAPAKFSFGKDSLLTLDALELADGASLALEGAFGKRSLHVAAEVTEDVLARISCAEGDVFQDEAGYIRAEPKPFLMLIR